jgi:hypothetical protein
MQLKKTFNKLYAAQQKNGLKNRHYKLVCSDFISPKTSNSVFGIAEQEKRGDKKQCLLQVKDTSS